MGNAVSVRSSIARALVHQGRDDPRLMVLSADGQLIFAPFIGQFPDRHVDVGIAEASLISVAAGLARTNRSVVVSTIASFLVRRAYEQISIDLCLDSLPVVLLGVGGGVEFGPMGPTHHAQDDIALLRSRPNMAIFIPCDAGTAEFALAAALDHPGPSYIRCGFANLPELPSNEDCAVLQDGSDLLILATGLCAHEALAAGQALQDEGISARVVNIVKINPMDGARLTRVLLDGRPILTVEEHLSSGGLGTIVTEWLGEHKPQLRVTRLGLDHRPPPVADHRSLLAFFGIDASAISHAAKQVLSQHREGQ